VAIRGNHDAMVLSGVVNERKEATFRHGDTLRCMTDEQRAYVEGWPAQLELESAFGPLLLVHGSPLDPLNGYVYPDTDLAPFAGRQRGVFLGQTHRPFVRTLDGTVFVNVGSCGLPRDSGNLGSACLFDDVSGVATVIRYDIEAATAAALRRCGPVAPDVLAVFDRRDPDGCLGEMRG
jgi:predicted phosphodiesterase